MRTIADIPTLDPRLRTALAAYKALVCAELGPDARAFFLFGSRAKGTDHADSDVDVAVVIDGDFRFYSAPDAVFDAEEAIAERFGLTMQVWPLTQRGFESPDKSWAPGISRAVAQEGVLF